MLRSHAVSDCQRCNHLLAGGNRSLLCCGVARTVPLLTTFLFLLGLAAIGMPGTSGFPAEFLILMSVLEVHTEAGMAALGTMALGAAYFLRLYCSSFLGPVTNNVVAESQDLNRREMFLLVLVSAPVFFRSIPPNSLHCAVYADMVTYSRSSFDYVQQVTTLLRR
ncbi:MAG: hypothetical protein AMS22_01895 [Thiotrichales bacterium SG8_50]|nr:MAG: hypothetical protein AMS22_01895 [Thiotrichales bacterium SG8_50]